MGRAADWAAAAPGTAVISSMAAEGFFVGVAAGALPAAVEAVAGWTAAEASRVDVAVAEGATPPLAGAAHGVAVGGLVVVVAAEEATPSAEAVDGATAGMNLPLAVGADGAGVAAADGPLAATGLAAAAVVVHGAWTAAPAVAMVWAKALNHRS
jgi:hypothetical protein